MGGFKGYAEVEGGRLYYEVTGRGPAVALVHGFTLDHRMWDPQLEAFSRRFKVIRYDMRGFGRSSLPEPGGAFMHARDLKALLDSLSVERAHVVGLSKGGHVATDFAALFPGAAASLVAVDSSLVGFRYSEEFSGFLAALPEVARRMGVEAAKRRFMGHRLFASAMGNPAAAGLLREIMADYSGWHWLNDVPEQVPEPPTAERLASIDAPTLVIVGEHDLPDFHRVADILSGGIPDARKLVLGGVGHMCSMEDPARFNSEVLSFLAGLPI
jgi:pimeloyl-ACP methyl ester carboxylesterase